MNIFLSYGHDDYPKLIEQLVCDFSKDHKVWTDEKLHISSIWHSEIDKNIKACDLFIFVHAAHSIREDSYCWGEIEYAQKCGKEVCVLVIEEFDNMSSLLLPFQSFRMESVIDYSAEFDIDQYQQIYPQLIAKIDSLVAKRSNSEALPLQSNSVSAKIEDKLSRFIGREELLCRIEKWHCLEHNNLCIMGLPGSGKSTISAVLYKKYNVRSVQFCDYSNIKTCTIRSVVEFIISDLCASLPEFKEVFMSSFNFERSRTMSLDDFVEEALLAPLRIANIEKPLLLIFEGLDEIPEYLRKDFFKVILDKLSPSDQLRVILTSRYEPPILHSLRRFEYTVLNLSEFNNDNDIRDLITTALEISNIDYSPQSIARAVKQCNGDYLYAKFIIEEIRLRNLRNIEEVTFPVGMKGVCESYLNRIYEDDTAEEYANVSSYLLGFLCIPKEPFEVEGIADILGIEERKLSQATKKLNVFLNRRDEKISIYHKSLYDWIKSMKLGDPYYVPLRDIKNLFVKWIFEKIEAEDDDEYLYKYAFLHIFELNGRKLHRDVAKLLIGANEKYLDSFNASLLEQIRLDKNLDDYQRVFTDICSIERKPCRVIYSAIKHLTQNEQDDFVSVITSNFVDTPYYEALQLFINFTRHRLKSGNSKELIELGLQFKFEEYDINTQSDLISTLADAYRVNGFYKTAAEYYAKAVSLAKRTSYYGVTYYTSKCALIDIAYLYGKIEQAFKQIHEVEREIQVNSADIIHYKYHRILGNLYHSLEERDKAYDEFNKCLTIAEKLNYSTIIIATLNSIASTEPEEERAKELIAKCREVSKCGVINRLEYGKSFTVEAERYNELGLYAQAKECAETSYQILESVGYGAGKARALLNFAYAKFHLGEYEDAIEPLLKAEEHYIKEEIYPFLRVKAFHTLLCCADKIGRLKEFITVDNVDDIANLHYYQYCEPISAAIRELVNKGAEM